MFTTNEMIDAVQNGKKQAVKIFVTNETIADSMNSFIDAQTEYTKSAVNSMTKAATDISTETVRAVQKASKFDYAKFGEGIMKAYSDQFLAKK